MPKQLPINRIFHQDVIKSDGSVEGERLLYPINLNFETINALINGQIKHGENIDDEIREFSFTTSSTYVASNTFTPITFRFNLNKRPQGVRVMQLWLADSPTTIVTKPVYIHWREVKEKISIDFITGLADSTAYTIRVMVE